jgi:hypothetical protein
MAKPPKVGMFCACCFRSVGSSNNPFSTETLIIAGIAKKVMMNAIDEESRIVSMDFSKRYEDI